MAVLLGIERKGATMAPMHDADVPAVSLSSMASQGRNGSSAMVLLHQAAHLCRHDWEHYPLVLYHWMV